MRGRCRHCGAPISARYPAIEALTAVTFAVVAAIAGVDAELWLALPKTSVLEQHADSPSATKRGRTIYYKFATQT